MIIENIDLWDRRVFHEEITEDYNLKRVEKIGTDKVHNYCEFMMDVFGGLYKHSPKVRDSISAPTTEKWADEVYSEITKLPEWQALRARTVMDQTAAAVATSTFCENFLDAIPQRKRKDQPLEVSELDMSTVRTVARSACATASAAADEVTDMVESFGYNSSNGNVQHAAPTKKRELAHKLMGNSYLKRVAQLAGRMRRIAEKKQKEKVRHGVDEITNITIGDDLGRLIPAELSKLNNKLMKKDFYKKLLEHSLIQYELTGIDRRGRGPIVLCVDESGSMAGNRDIWAKAVAMALIQIAQKQKRDCVLIHFDSRVTRLDKFSKVVDMPTLMDSISHFSNGGTDFVPPLNAAIKNIKDGNKNADIVFITDGCSDLSDEYVEHFKKDKKDLQFSMISIGIDCDPTVLRDISDTTVVINNLYDDSDATDAMFSI